ncbi:MAG: hypothetical protein FWD78_07980 [Treponema sp.]|nr:hypothetical protein [Treponema sp.]
MKLSDEARSVLNDDYYVQNFKKWIGRLTNLFNGSPDPYLDEYVFSLSGITGQSKLDMYNQPEEWTIECLEDLARRIGETENENVFVPVCFHYPLYGVHFVDKIFGANVFFKDGQWWSDVLKKPVGSLEYPDLENNEVFGLAKRACLFFLEQDLKVPVFGLPTIACALNIIINLYGEEVLAAMVTDGDAVRHDLKIINDTLTAIHQWHRKTIPVQKRQPVIPANRTLPYDYSQICGCSTALISAECYNEYIAAYDAELLGVYPNGGMIHLCGSHAQHIKTFREMKELRAVQINDRASWDIKKYYDGLREDQIIYLNPCKEMTAEKAVEITGGNRLAVVGDKHSVFKKKR